MGNVGREEGGKAGREGMREGGKEGGRARTCVAIVCPCVVHTIATHVRDRSLPFTQPHLEKAINHGSQRFPMPTHFAAVLQIVFLVRQRKPWGKYGENVARVVVRVFLFVRVWTRK